MDYRKFTFKLWNKNSETRGSNSSANDYRDAPPTDANANSPPPATSNSQPGPLKSQTKTQLRHTPPNDNGSSSIRNAPKYGNELYDANPVASAAPKNDADKSTKPLPAAPLTLAGFSAPVPGTKDVPPCSLEANEKSAKGKTGNFPNKPTKQHLVTEEASHISTGGTHDKTGHLSQSSNVSRVGDPRGKAAERSTTSQNHRDDSRTEPPIGGNLPSAVTKNQPWPLNSNSSTPNTPLNNHSSVPTRQKTMNAMAASSAKAEEASHSVERHVSTTVTSNHGNEPLNDKVVVGLDIDQKNESTQSEADESTKPSPTPANGDISANTLAAEESTKQRSPLKEPTEQPLATDGTADDRSNLYTNGTNEKTGHSFQPRIIDDGDHLKTQMSIYANTPQEDPNLGTKFLNLFKNKSDKPRRKGEKAKKIHSEKFEAKHVETDDLDVDDVIIAVMGPTGSGKSTFITEATGVDTGIGHDLESCTSEIGMIKMSFLGYHIVFVDTPGFDDTKKSDSDILKMISDWLEKTYKKEILLSGLLYFHRISDNRMAGTPLKNLRLFEQLCGKNAFKNVILTTTMWDEVDEETGATREAELKGIYWKDMISRSSTIGRFEGSRDSAFRLISPFLDEASTRNRVRLQKELVNLDLKLSETRAGQRLRSELKQLAKQQQELLHQTREELKLPNNTESLKTLMEEYEELKRTSGSLLAQMADLQIPLGRQFMKTITITFGIKRNREKEKDTTLVEAKDDATTSA